MPHSPVFKVRVVYRESCSRNTV